MQNDFKCGICLTKYIMDENKYKKEIHNRVVKNHTYDFSCDGSSSRLDDNIG